MKYIAFLFFLMIQCQAAELQNISGMWIGSYEYDNDGGKISVPCSMVIEQQYMTILGRMLEVQTFGDPSAVGLSADVKGVIDEKNLYFVKTYDGSGNKSHSITYKLIISNDGKTMEGKWFIQQGFEGTIKFKQFDPKAGVNGAGASDF